MRLSFALSGDSECFYQDMKSVDQDGLILRPHLSIAQPHRSHVQRPAAPHGLRDFGLRCMGFIVRFLYSCYPLPFHVP
jgi:hypothetical protein